LLGNCTYNVHTIETDELNQTLALTLYPLVDWDERRESSRTFTWEGSEVTINGWEIQGTLEQSLNMDLLNEETEYADDDYWEFMLAGDKLKKLGYERIMAQEEKEDRQLVALRSNDGHLLILSSIVDYFDPELRMCPCDYTFTVFTDDERVQLK